MFTTGDTEIDQDVSIQGVAASISMDSDIYAYVTFQGGLGFSMAKDNFSFALDYKLNAFEHVNSHGVFGTLRYEFQIKV